MELLVGAEWQQHPRIHVKLDTSTRFTPPIHQKIVVIDDRVAFVAAWI
jgi:phosphatidylserine/phosphatidylglycerophosphate/cardiolipin synthase-like enzyme